PVGRHGVPRRLAPLLRPSRGCQQTESTLSAVYILGTDGQPLYSVELPGGGGHAPRDRRWPSTQMEGVGCGGLVTGACPLQFHYKVPSHIMEPRGPGRKPSLDKGSLSASMTWFVTIVSL